MAASFEPDTGERILTAADVRALPKGTALLLATGVRPALVRGLPWHEGPRAASITEARDRAAAGLAGTTARSTRWATTASCAWIGQLEHDLGEFRKAVTDRAAS